MKKFKRGAVDMLVIIVLVVIGVSAAGFYFVNIQGSQEPEVVYVETPDPVYTLEEVAQHSEETDCWMAIDGKVYDITEYIAEGEHPGGGGLTRGCGLDASEMFKGPHSDETKTDLLPQYEIGLLQE